MSLEIGLFLGVIACVLLVWYLYRRSKKDTSDDANRQPDDADSVDDTEAYEDLLLTGVMLSEVYDDDQASSDDIDSDGYESIDDGGGFDDSGFE